MDPSNPPPEFNYNCYFTVSRDSGILQAQGGQFNFVATTKMRYYLSDLQHADTTHPSQFALMQNYPNPFNGFTNIRFEILNGAFVNLTVYDLLGRSVAVLVEEPLKAGRYQRVFDGRGLASGAYFYRLQVAGFMQTKKLILSK